MAGMDWFRWHHGSVTDPKFQLIAKKAGASVAEVIAVWAFLLEAASQSEKRGNPGDPDFESMDCALGLDDGISKSVYERMNDRGMFTEDGFLTAWEKRQPKRERDDDNSTDRVRAFRARRQQETPRNATETAETPREEKSREEERKEDMPGFALFWAAWPSSDRKQARGKCRDAWKKAGAEPHAALVVAHVERMKAGAWQKDGGRYVPAPLTYLNQRRWEGAEDSANDDPFGIKGAL